MTPETTLPGTARRVVVGTSWKMTKTIGEGTAYVDRLLATPLPAGLEVFVLPSHTALAAVRAALPADGAVRVGAQDAHWADHGPLTGAVSMAMVADAGASLVEIGHSERRAFGETSDHVRRKVRAALDHGLEPLLCVGESASQRRLGTGHTAVAGQLQAALAGLDPADRARVLVAYEPEWAIGSTPAQPAHVADMADHVRRLATPGGVLYGGGVTVETAPALLRDGGVDGLFVGRAAWRAEDFRALLEACARVLPDLDPPAPSAPGAGPVGRTAVPTAGARR